MDNDGLVTILDEGFKHQYRGKKAANDYWLNYSRCAQVTGEHFFFVSDKEQIVVYNLDTLKHLVDESPLQGQGPRVSVYPIYGQIQGFASVTKDLVIVLTEDGRLLSISFKNGGGGIKVAESKISEGTVSSTIYTEIVATASTIVASGYREQMRSNTFVLFHEALHVLDTIEVVNLEKVKSDQHHIHLMKLFFRKGIMHLLAINIACSMHLMVVHADRLHPICLNKHLSDGRLPLD